MVKKCSKEKINKKSKTYKKSLESLGYPKSDIRKLVSLDRKIRTKHNIC